MGKRKMPNQESAVKKSNREWDKMAKEAKLPPELIAKVQSRRKPK